jgi:hypothetical protein
MNHVLVTIAYVSAPDYPYWSAICGRCLAGGNSTSSPGEAVKYLYFTNCDPEMEVLIF